MMEVNTASWSCFTHVQMLLPCLKIVYPSIHPSSATVCLLQSHSRAEADPSQCCSMKCIFVLTAATVFCFDLMFDPVLAGSHL